MRIYLVYVTFESKKEAEQVVNHLFSKKLISCTNILPVQSKYVWKGKVNSIKEYVTLLKTTKPKKVETEILKIHSYDVPCILSWKAEANKDFGKWVTSCCK